MTLTAAPRATGSAVWAEALLLSFAQAGYVRAEPDILQPAEPFLDLSGEDIRKSLYLTSDAGGEELCLRPDLTIPVARASSAWTGERVMKEIKSAYADARGRDGSGHAEGVLEGRSVSGVRIRMVVRGDAIVTAYPIRGTSAR